MNRPRKLTLLYDAKCRLCTQTVEVLRGLRTDAELEMQPYQSADLERLIPGASLPELEAEIHAVDETGRIYKGADALILVLTTVSSIRWIAVFYRIPGMRPVAQLLYRWIAKSRYKLFGREDEDCPEGTCSVHGNRKEDGRRDVD